jgi:autotransporter-associated beta strand protein
LFATLDSIARSAPTAQQEIAMRATRVSRIAAILGLWLAAGPALAQDGSWTALASGIWSSPANWSGGIVADGAGSTATFATAGLTVPLTVTLDTNRTIGNLVFDNPTNNFGWTVRGTTTLTLSSGATPSIAVNNANISATLTATLAGTQGFVKNGAGLLSLTSNNTGLSGGINVAAGILAVTGSPTINPLGSNVITLSGGTLRLGSGGGFNQNMVVAAGRTFANTGLTATMDGGTAITGNTWYEIGQNVANPTTGLPMGQTVPSETTAGVSYTFQPAMGRNAMLLDNQGGNTTGRFTLASPTALSQVFFATSSGNGTGTITATIHYSDGTADATGLVFTSPDWFNNTPVAITAHGRISAAGYNNVGTTNPRLYDEFITNPNPANPIASIDLSWSGSGATTHTAIFALNTPVLNGDPAQNFTNNVVVTADSAVDVRSVAGATLGNVSIGTNVLNVTGLPGTALALGSITMSGNPTISPAAGLVVTTGALSDGGTVRTFTKGGAGTLTLPTASPGLSAGTAAVVSSGTLNLNNATALGSSPNVTVNGGNFNLGTGVSATLASLAGSGGAVTLNANTLTINGTGSANYAGSIVNGTGPGALTKSGSGTQTLSGANSYSGGTTVSAGTLAVTGAGGLGTGPVNLSGGTLSVSGGPPIVTVTGFGGSGTGWTQNGNAVFPGGDVLQLTDAVNGQVGSAWNNTPVPTRAFTASFRYTVPVASAPPADGITFTLQNQGTNAIGGGGGLLGYGGITPSAALRINIYPPNTTGGTGSGYSLLLNGAAPDGTPAIPIAPVDPGLVATPTDVVMNFDGTNATVTFTQGANMFSTGPVPFSFAIGSTALLGFTGATGGLNAQQQISNFTFTTLPLANYTNDVNVAAGTSTIAIAATAATPAITFGALSMASGSTLNVVPDSSTPAGQAYFLTFGATTLNGPATLSVANNGAGFGTLTLGTVSGPGSLTKAGPGVLVLPTANTYAGATNVNGGRLIVTNSTGSATGAGLVTVNSGGTLGGTGIIGGNIQVNAGGTIEPGSPMFPATAPGLLTANGNVTFAGGTFRAKLNGTAAGAGYDQLQVGGTLSLGNNVTALSTSLGFAPAAANSLTIIQGGTVDAGRFQGLPDNTTFLVGTFSGTPYSATIHYTTNSVFLNNFQVVPEPVHLLLVGGLVGAAWRWRRRGE